MRLTVKKCGNSGSVRIPSSIMEAANLMLDDAVDIREEAGRIIIEPIRVKEYILSQLLAGITIENRHANIDFEAPIGKELL
jgi:antitoxin MazE